MPHAAFQRLLRLAALCGLLLGPLFFAPLAARQGAVTAPRLDFARVFASPSLGGSSPRGVQLSPDGRWLTLLRPRAEDRERYDLWGYDRKSGQWRMLVDSAKLGSNAALSEAEKMQRERARIGDLKGVVSYQWRADGQALLVPLDGALYLVSLDGTAQRIDGAAGALNPRLSAKGLFVSWVAERRLWVAPVGGGAARPVTPEEKADTVHWGEAEFVAQEEMMRMEGAWWSPDDAHIAIERFDEAPVGVVTRAAIGAAGTTTYAQRYPAAGTRNAEVRLFVMRPDGSGGVEVDLGPDKDIYLARVDWAADGKVLYVQRQNRAQTRLDMLAVDPATGKAKVLFSEEARAKSWINLSKAYRFLKDGSLIWWSERDGFGHLYHVAKGQWRQLTHGRWMVTDLVGVDEKAGQTLVVSRSAPVQPVQIYLADAKGTRLQWVEENRVAGDHPYAPYLPAHRPTTFGTLIAADGSTLHWRMITPVMEPGKRYPVFFQHYGGPHAQQVTRGWGGALAQAIVARGFVWFEIDNRGSANRGVDFESQIWRAMGSVEVADQKVGAEYLKSLPFVDPAKIATYGWSYGGYMTLKMLAADPGTYAAGIAGAPVTSWELYDTHYTERYLGTPAQDPKVYATSGALEEATRIRDPLLLIHGMADDNVVFENSTLLAARLQGAARPFDMMFYPGQTHRVSGPGVSVHLWEGIFAFLARNGVTPPR